MNHKNTIPPIAEFKELKVFTAQTKRKYLKYLKFLLSKIPCQEAERLAYEKAIKNIEENI